jgi:hypothetical protein
MQKRFLLLMGALCLVLGFGGPAMADYVYVQEMTSYEDLDPAWPMLTWTGNASSVEDAITGASDYVPSTGEGDAGGWNRGWGNMVFDFGEVLSGDDVDITFWHFGGIKNGVANGLINFYVSENGTDWSGGALLEDVQAGGTALFETTYDLGDTFGVDAIRYLMVEKVSGGSGTGKFIDAVGVNAVPVPGAVWLLGGGLLGLVGLRRRKN